MLRSPALIALFLIALFHVGAPLPAQAAPPPCARLEEALMRLGDPDPAECLEGKALANVHATPPKGLKLGAVRGLYVDDGGRYADIDPRHAPVDLDRPDAAGNPPAGAVFLLGTPRWKGRLRHEPGNGWTLAFLPDRRSGDATSPLRRAFATIVLDREDGTLPVVPPTTFGTECWEATATARFVDFSVVLGEGELAGVRPVAFHLSDVRDFRACAPPDSTP